jgi:DNA-directed RNA polymerase specialized sigma24 family protein
MYLENFCPHKPSFLALLCTSLEKVTVIMHVDLATELEDEHLSPQEVNAAIQGLSDTDTLRLSEIARQCARRCSLEADELLNEAIVAALLGERKCPRNVLLIAFLAQTMRSITYNERRKARAECRAELMNDNPDNDPVLSLPDEGPSPADTAGAKREAEYIFFLFEDDGDVMMLLMGLYDGYDPDEICEINGWDRTTYNTVRKRLRRGLNKHFPEGRQP